MDLKGFVQTERSLYHGCLIRKDKWGTQDKP